MLRSWIYGSVVMILSWQIALAHSTIPQHQAGAWKTVVISSGSAHRSAPVSDGSTSAVPHDTSNAEGVRNPSSPVLVGGCGRPHCIGTIMVTDPSQDGRSRWLEGISILFRSLFG